MPTGLNKSRALWAQLPRIPPGLELRIAFVDFYAASSTSQHYDSVENLHLANVAVHAALPPPSQEALACGAIAAHVVIHAHSSEFSWDGIERTLCELVHKNQRDWVITVNKFVDALRMQEGNLGMAVGGLKVKWKTNCDESQMVPDSYLINFVVNKLEHSSPLFARTCA